jgi:predicted RNA-binding Zn-ribbon protein involved in translation (DUF1610 family)
MAQSVEIHLWCDVCLEADDYTAGETVTIPATLGVAAFEAELCPHHAEPLQVALGALARVGRAPEKRRTTPGPGRVRPDETPGRESCPTCGTTTTTRAQLRGHLRKHHDQSLADVGLEPANFTCPECGNKFGAGQGYAAHLRASHGITRADIHAENPGKAS